MSTKINLVLQSFGRQNEYLRTIFCLWSFYAHVSREFAGTKSLLFTDKPEFFQAYLNDLPVEYIFLSPEKIIRMRGEIDFLHRIKISIIEEAFQRSGESVIYVDGDACFVDDPSPLFRRLSEKISFMHINEYAFISLRELPLPSGAPFHAVLKTLENKEFFLANGLKQKFSPSLFSWNAGVIILHHKHQALLSDVYALTEQLFPLTGSHASEQYAFSIVLQTKTELHACDKFIFHYWYRIKKQVADNFMSKNIDHSWGLLARDRKIFWVKKWTKRLPEYFENHPLTLRDNAIQSFNNNECVQGYYWAAKALIKNPFNVPFLKDCFYHTKRFLLQDHIPR